MKKQLIEKSDTDKAVTLIFKDKNKDAAEYAEAVVIVRER